MPRTPFWQLIAIVGQLAQAETGHSLWDVEDADFAAALERFANDLARREFSQAEPAAGSDRGGTWFSPGATASESPRQVS